jgi:hypothetical protein
VIHVYIFFFVVVFCVKYSHFRLKWKMFWTDMITVLWVNIFHDRYCIMNIWCIYLWAFCVRFVLEQFLFQFISILRSGLTVINVLSMSLHSYSKKTSNQNSVLNKFFVLIGQFWSMNIKIVLQILMTAYTGIPEAVTCPI